ncbi:hemolysin family protein [Candidatus Oleimmundimicrobium sp.]|uniref:hemolysin family protein n=1 Tax=Candidatus Oleimmundimicrobium sp. TaxID=3060597 RepID=UPI002722C28D|nr:hemolysin family protein [Candidatus Oleimmundimicrobium sp.]MDO8885842.1 hemolysin family protein [Candidatus Oleimmundimicrobium sp.]
MELNILSQLVGFLILLFLSAFSSMAETALISVNKIRVRSLAKKGDNRAIVLERLLDKPDRFLAAILFLNNVVNIGAASLATMFVSRYVSHYAVAISTGIVTFLVLLYGEITPKTFATQNAEKISLFVAKPVLILSVTLYPIVHFLTVLANLLIKLIGGKPLKKGTFITEEEIKTLVTVGEEAGVIEEEEKEMIHSIFEFGDTMAKEIMVPRIDIVAIESTALIKELLDLIIEKGHSRIPVYEKTVDNVVGIIYAKDLLARPKSDRLSAPLKDLMHPAYYVPETMKLDDLLRELRNRKTHMAIVVDEYGGTAGIVTIEDILEEIVGEIFDEYDLEMVMVERIDDNNIRVDARVSLDEINEILGINLPDMECETIGGFVYDLIGKIPTSGEKVDFKIDSKYNLTFTVERVIKRRISKILITKSEFEKEEDDIDCEDK